MKQPKYVVETYARLAQWGGSQDLISIQLAKMWGCPNGETFPTACTRDFASLNPVLDQDPLSTLF
jgi:hypothetical protein